MKKIILFCLFCSCFLMAETKIGYIEAQAIMSQYDDVKQVQVELEKEQRRLKGIYEGKVSTLDSLITAYETKSMLMSEQKQEEMTTMINDKRIELEQWQIKYFGPEGELYRMESLLLAPIYKTITEVIEKYAIENNYDFILEQNVLLFSDPKYNLTEIIVHELKKLNTINDDNESK